MGVGCTDSFRSHTCHVTKHDLVVHGPEVLYSEEEKWYIAWFIENKEQDGGSFPVTGVTRDQTRRGRDHRDEIETGVVYSIPLGPPPSPF